MLDDWNLTRGYIDSCQYNQAILKSFFVLFLLCILTVFLIFLLAETIAWWIYILLNGFILPNEPAFIFTIVFLLIILALGVGTLNNKSKTTQVIYDNSKELWIAWKEKHCHKITVI